MPQVLIENPVINSPFVEPRRHFRFDDEGITKEINEFRRPSGYFVPVPQPRARKGGRQLSFDTEWTNDRLRENTLVNQIREKVGIWRKGGYREVTKATASLLQHWQSADRFRSLFFCQIEALETAIYLTEVARKYNDQWIENSLRTANEEANPGLYRVAFKMATGSGKTVVMAMLIAWQVFNKMANPQDPRFTDSFLIVTPGITIRDRLGVLLPNSPNNYYAEHDVVPKDRCDDLNRARIIVTNFHTFLRRERNSAGKLTKLLLSDGKESPFTETPDQMVLRVCREFGRKAIMVINDEAHHCYRRKAEDTTERLTGDDRKEAEGRNKKARVWLSGLEAVQSKLGIKVVWDLSATPFFLRGSGYSEGTLFPWVVSDFGLVDSIESGIVKVPRVPVADDSVTGDRPTYRYIWDRIRDHLPKKGRSAEYLGGEQKVPVVLEGALKSLYGNYEKYYRKWETNEEARAKGQTPPVFIVVCNNTSVSKLVFDYVAGWEKELPDGSKLLVPGKLAIFSNVDGSVWRPRPNTVLIDSEQLESGEAMSEDFKRIAAVEIEEFKAEYRRRFPGRDPGSVTDEDLLREVMNTVGKPGKLGEQIRCVVSVSMLTEGWDANTVTHILGVRAFGTQLLCEQVVGRGLRRIGYTPNAQGMLDPQYAEVYGVPFSFIPCSGSTDDPRPGPTPTRVRAIEDRIACEITFPRLVGYRYDLPEEHLEASYGRETQMALTTEDIPSTTENAPIVGETVIHTLDDLKRRRDQEIAFLLAKLVLEKYFRQDGAKRTDRPQVHHFDGEVKAWLFPEVLAITRRWLKECVTCKGNAFKQMLLLIEPAHEAADHIYRMMVSSTEGKKTLKPILRPYDMVGSTRHVDFDTVRDVYVTNPKFCHVSHVVCDTKSWEQKMAQVLEELADEGLVASYVKNQGLGFCIPYTITGEDRNYMPDFIVRLRLGDEVLNLILEVSGEPRKDKAAKVATARSLWVPAVNNDCRFGRWAFLEITDPWDAQGALRGALSTEIRR
jgi:type III restriction enzyme